MRRRNRASIDCIGKSFYGWGAGVLTRGIRAKMAGPAGSGMMPNCGCHMPGTEIFAKSWSFRRPDSRETFFDAGHPTGAGRGSPGE